MDNSCPNLLMIMNTHAHIFSTKHILAIKPESLDWERSIFALNNNFTNFQNIHLVATIIVKKGT